jgi:hypothetical protein
MIHWTVMSQICTAECYMHSSVETFSPHSNDKCFWCQNPEDISFAALENLLTVISWKDVVPGIYDSRVATQVCECYILIVMCSHITST